MTRVDFVLNRNSIRPTRGPGGRTPGSIADSTCGVQSVRRRSTGGPRARAPRLLASYARTPGGVFAEARVAGARRLGAVLPMRRRRRSVIDLELIGCTMLKIKCRPVD